MTSDVNDAEAGLPPERDEPDFIEVFVAAHWKLVTVIAWAATVGVLLWMKWGGIHWFSLGDTDDNMRFDQVRDWLNGQGWYDLRQYRLNPPLGFSIHWSRLVDLPIAAILLICRPLFGEYAADRIAVAAAPMLPMLPAFLAMTVTVRRLVNEWAYAVALAMFFGASGTMAMWTPLRIDHHGWQLAFLMITVAALGDARPVRSGVVVALSSALSLVIGLELLPYAVFAGAAIALHWCWDRTEAKRMFAYGLAMAAATGLGFLIFASNDNWTTARCDALTPVWLSVVVFGALLLAGLSRLRVENPWVRLALVLAAGAITVAFYAICFPQCLGHRLENVSPEVDALWLSHVREARPIYTQPLDYVLGTLALPVIGAIGAAIALWRTRATRAAADWLPALLFTLFAGLLTLWQVRTGPSAQMLAIPGATWLAVFAMARLFNHRLMLVRVLGPVLAFLLCSGLAVGYLAQYLPNKAEKKAAAANNAAGGKPAKKKPDATELANRRCPTIPAMAPLDAFPAATFLTHVDLGPRLITLTHHSAIAGPYHRNGDAILDTLHAFRGTPDAAHAIILRHRAAYVLVCPHLSESTIYQAEAPAGFYAKLMSGYTPSWLVRMPLPAKSPFILWKVVG